MSLTLTFGCVDIPYATPPSATGKATKAVTTTTGEVAGWLENKYHVMEHYYEAREKQITEALADSMAGALETLLAGGPADAPAPFAEAESFIQNDFQQFMALDTLATLGYPGVPTKAALEGVNTRLKKRKGAPRPSLIDTGLYVNSFKCWTV